MSIIVTFAWTMVNHTTVLHLPLIVYCSFPTYIGYFALGCYSLFGNKVNDKYHR